MDFPPLEFLKAKQDWVLAAPKDKGPILTLCVRPREGERRFVSNIDFDPTKGVVGDRWLNHTWMHLEDGSPDPRVQVCILSMRVLQLVRPEGLEVYPGDNIIADMDFSINNLPVGQKLQVGTAILEVTDVFNTACTKWRERYGVDSVKWINLLENKTYRLRGIFAQVIQAGSATLSDVIKKG